MLDSEIISDIQKGGIQREKALKFLFENNNLRRSIIELIKNNKGNEQDGEDMFQEGIIVIDRNIRGGDFRSEGKLSSYLISICKFLWMNELRKNKRLEITDETYVFDSPVTETALDTLLNDELKIALNRLLVGLGERCKNILELWQLNYSMEEIASSLGLSSAGMARKVKHQCYQKLLESVATDSVIQQFKNG